MLFLANGNDRKDNEWIKVVVRTFTLFREIIKKKTLEIKIKEGASVHQLLDVLCETYNLRDNLFDEKDELLAHVQIMKNGRNIKFLDGLRTKLDQNDEIALFPPTAGGYYTN
ncbi:MAG: ubiquitin-like small modifier protein 1 [Candidatus Hodarchaeales archaeon]